LKSQTKKEQEQDKYEWEMERFYYHFKAAKTFGPIFIVQIYCRIQLIGNFINFKGVEKWAVILFEIL